MIPQKVPFSGVLVSYSQYSISYTVQSSARSDFTRALLKLHFREHTVWLVDVNFHAARSCLYYLLVYKMLVYTCQLSSCPCTEKKEISFATDQLHQC